MVEENWERKYEERCNICGESIDYIIKQKVREAQKEERENHIRTLDYIINGWVSNAKVDIIDWCKELRKQLNNN